MSRMCVLFVPAFVLAAVTAPAIARDISGQYDFALRGTNIYLDRTPPRRAISDNTSMSVTQSGDRVRMELGSYAGASAATIFEGQVDNDRPGLVPG